MDRVLITGGSRGIGAACVRLFASEGYRVGFVYEKSEGAAAALARETGALAIRADVRERAALERAVDRLGGADVLVANAGVSEFKMVQDIVEADWRRVIDVNLSGAFFAAQAVLPGMVSRRHGSMLFVSSIWGLVGASCEVHYSASKGALIAMTKALAKELAPSGIRVNCVAPGVIDTDMNASLSIEDRQVLAEETLLGRLGTPEEVAQALLFLASDRASYITGQILSPNGGYMI